MRASEGSPPTPVFSRPVCRCLGSVLLHEGTVERPEHLGAAGMEAAKAVRGLRRAGQVADGVCRSLWVGEEIEHRPVPAIRAGQESRPASAAHDRPSRAPTVLEDGVEDRLHGDHGRTRNRLFRARRPSWCAPCRRDRVPFPPPSRRSRRWASRRAATRPPMPAPITTTRCALVGRPASISGFSRSYCVNLDLHAL